MRLLFRIGDLGFSILVSVYEVCCEGRHRCLKGGKGSCTEHFRTGGYVVGGRMEVGW